MQSFHDHVHIFLSHMSTNSDDLLLKNHCSFFYQTWHSKKSCWKRIQFVHQFIMKLFICGLIKKNILFTFKICFSNNWYILQRCGEDASEGPSEVSFQCLLGIAFRNFKMTIALVKYLYNSTSSVRFRRIHIIGTFFFLFWYSINCCQCSKRIH